MSIYWKAIHHFHTILMIIINKVIQLPDPQKT